MVWEAGLREPGSHWGSWCHMLSETRGSEFLCGVLIVFSQRSLLQASGVFCAPLTYFWFAGGRFDYFQTSGWALGWSQAWGKSWILSSAVLRGKLFLPFLSNCTDDVGWCHWCNGCSLDFHQRDLPKNACLRRTEAESPSVKSCRVCSCSLACDCVAYSGLRGSLSWLLSCCHLFDSVCSAWRN